jgi:transcription elongation factor Elf1
MPTLLSDRAEIAIGCPKCGHKTKQTVGWVKANETMVCGGCGNEFGLEKETFIKSLADAERELRKVIRETNAKT